MPSASALPVSPGELLLGVDGGGSKTVAWLARPESDGCFTVVGRGTADAANPRAVGLTAAAGAVVSAVELAFSDAKLPLQPAVVAVLAIAGAAETAPAEQLRTKLFQADVADAIHVVPDATPLLAAGTPEGFGIALVSGTGSVAFGCSDDGRTGTAGGYGFLFGDEGSGYWLGRQALAEVVASLDGRRPSTSLSKAVLEQIRAKDARGIKDAIYGSNDPRHQIAALAPTVVQCANAGDSVAGKIICDGAKELAKLVASVASQLGLLDGPFPLALSGSVLSKCERVRDEVLRQIESLGCQADPISVVADPVEGCLHLAIAKIDVSR